MFSFNQITIQALFKIVVLLMWILSVFGCELDKSDSKKIEIQPLTKKRYDSLRNIIFHRLEPHKGFEVFYKLEKETQHLEDFDELLKRYKLMLWYYIISSDYRDGDAIIEKLKTYYKDHNKWSDYMMLSKMICIYYRGRGRNGEMEAVLKEAITMAQKHKEVYPYDLLPIHELSVFYTYDIGKHKEAVKYGELFFDKVRIYDTIKSRKKVFDSIKGENVHILSLTLGRSYTELGELDKAYPYLEYAEKSFEELHNVGVLTRVYSNFIDYYLKKKDVEKLNYYKKKYLTFSQSNNDSLLSTRQKISETNLKLISNEKKVFLEEEENKIKILVIAVLGVLLFLTVIFQRFFLKLKYEKESIHLALEKEQEFKKFRASLFINIAHEIRTPLSLILGYIDLSTDKTISKAELRKYLKEIRRKSNKVIRNVSDIISLLKEGKPKEELKLENIIIEPHLQQLFFSFEAMANIKEITLSYKAELPENFSMLTNLKKLESLINNLVGNAIKFSRKGSKVSLLTFIADNHIYIKVVDQSSGISEVNLKHIFDKFYQEENKGSSEGFGIGLAIVKDIVDVLKGKITVESTLNKGATFSVMLPFDTAEMNELTTVSRESQVERKSDTKKRLVDNLFNKKNKLLIVEDNAYMVDYYDRLLSKLYQCDYVFNGIEALEKLKNVKYDLVISDVMMPEMNGIELRKEMKKLFKDRYLPFIMVTAMDYEENKLEAYNLGIDDYIAKPFSKNELIARINRLIENKNQREAWTKDLDDTDGKIETYDEKNLRSIQQVIVENIDKDNFTVSRLAELVNFSQRQLERIIKNLTGLTPVKFILEVRLQEAYKKIKNKEEVDVNNVRYSVGFKSASYFSVKFKERFGVSPSELLKEKNRKV
ncbi:Signal transduction histidine kinase [Tenacibaculum sp. MAR_2009_124]|uniref:hybrid sensor histidine kinase/response regulator transcription factor n=1 Tax=Tenacibaculum sp. MAR_2009_124 TaxID=1250059 RepID=UPI0008948BFD|nr:response regulator [Tenacibaculum sp. MAR_2009_124]SEB35462.1 Signal transduction histidine kinase [Tenacibaculum sp. MAR_2009_124]